MAKASMANSEASFDSGVASAVRVGLDLGTNSSVLTAARDGKPLELRRDIIKSVVGFPKAGIIPGILPSDTQAIFGEEAIDYRMHVDLQWVLHEGCVRDVDVCSLFTKHLRGLIDSGGKIPLWGVVGAPANCTPKQQKDLRATMVGVLDRLLVVPEPFLAAMGLRDDPAYRDSGNDPTKHSLIVDIGAGTTDLCLVRGYYPNSDDQVSFPNAGNFIDSLVLKGVERRYPDLKLTPVTITQLKEQHSFVDGFVRDAKVKVYVDGRPQTVDLSEIIREACGSLIPSITKGIKGLLKRCDSDSIVNVMENIIVTGGGSQIVGLCESIEKALHEDGYDCARAVRPNDYKRLVARGGLKVAENVRDDQWQFPM